MMKEFNEILAGLLPSIKSISLEVVEAMLMTTATAGDDWETVERLSGDFDHIVTMGVSNSDFQGVIMVATSSEKVDDMFTDTEELLDVLGELANQYCGMLMDNSEIVDVFGILEQSIPMYTAKRAFFPRALAISGKIYFDEMYIELGFAARPFLMTSNR